MYMYMAHIQMFVHVLRWPYTGGNPNNWCLSQSYEEL